MPAAGPQIVGCIERLIEEKIRLENINARREELLKRNVSRDLIESGVEDSKRKIAQAKAELTGLLERLENK